MLLKFIIYIYRRKSTFYLKDESKPIHLETMFSGYMKHIGYKDERYAVGSTFLVMKKYAALIPEDQKGKRIFLFSFAECNILGDPKGMVFDIAYDSVDDLIDDSWAVD